MSDSSITPNIHLALGDDADVNRNWEILDQAIKAIGLRTIIPDNVLIQGNLEVAGNTQLDGTLQVSAPTTLGILNVSNTATFLSAVAMDGAVIIPNGPVTLPPGSIAGAALAPGAAVQGVWVGTARTTPLGLNPTLVELASVATDATEDPNRWSLVVAQATARLEFGASGTAPNGTVTLTIRRGATDVQSRTFTYDTSYLGTLDGLDLDIPYTMIRLAKPGDTTNIWRVMGSLTQVGGGDPLDVFCQFAQVHTIQFR